MLRPHSLDACISNHRAELPSHTLVGTGKERTDHWQVMTALFHKASHSCLRAPAHMAPPAGFPRLKLVLLFEFLEKEDVGILMVDLL